MARPVPRKISASLPALARCRSRGRLRSGSVPSRKASSEELLQRAPRAAPRPEESPKEELWSPTSPEARFHLELKRVSSEVDEAVDGTANEAGDVQVRRRQLSTRKHLEQVRREISSRGLRRLDLLCLIPSYTSSSLICLDENDENR